MQNILRFYSFLTYIGLTCKKIKKADYEDGFDRNEMNLS